MFCYQCEQTSHGTGCTELGVCGKTDDAAALQDLLVHAAKGISQYAHRAAQIGVQNPEVDRFVAEALFTTVTNVNFDAERMAGLLCQAADVRATAKGLYEAACLKSGQPIENLAGTGDLDSGGGYRRSGRSGQHGGHPGPHPRSR